MSSEGRLEATPNRVGQSHGSLARSLTGGPLPCDCEDYEYAFSFPRRGRGPRGHAWVEVGGAFKKQDGTLFARADR